MGERRLGVCRVKGRAWSDDLPLVTVPKAHRSKRVTLLYPYYENPGFLAEQLARMDRWPYALQQNVEVIIVDDGSPTHPLMEAFAAIDKQLGGISSVLTIRLFRILVDLRWNWLAARNIGFHHAAPGWVLVTDMDHVVSEATMVNVVEGQHDERTIYGFSRREHTGQKISPHPNSWLITREMFWKVGGYDEALSGHYGTDGDWRRRCAKVAPIAIIEDELVRYEYVGDSSTTRYKRKQPEDSGVRQLIAARGKGWKPRTLSFPYTEVAVVPC